MKTIFLALALAPLSAAAQTITRTIEPVSHTVSLSTRLIKLRYGLSPSLYLRIRSRGDAWFLYADIETTGIGSQDYIALVLDTDTLVCRSTGPQTGSDYDLHEREVEYALTVDALRKLSVGRLREVLLSRVDGVSKMKIPGRSQAALQQVCTELLKP